MIVTNWLRMMRYRWSYYSCRRRDPQFRRMSRRRRPLSLPATVQYLEDRTLLSNVAFAVSGPSSVTEDTSDGDNNLAGYTISYTGSLGAGETVSVDVAHALNQTSSADFTNTLTSAVNAAISGVSGVSFNGTTLSFTNSSGGGSPSAYAGTVTQASGGDATWTNISNASGSTTGNYAEVTLDDHDEAAALRLTNFGFSIPTGATITGITVALTTTGPNSPRSNHSVKLTKNGTTVAGTTSTATGTWATGGPTVGGSTNLWNTTWTPAEVNSSNFGLLIQLEGRNDDSTYRLDRAQITVTYTGGGGTAPTSVSFSLGIEDEDSTSESNEAYSINLSNSARTGSGTTSIGTSSVQTTIVNYTPPNQAPTAVNDGVSTNVNTAVFINVLANDSDPESDPISLISVTQPTHGDAEIRPNVSATIWNEWITTGQSNYATFNDFYSGEHGNPATLTWGILYTPDTDYSGGDSFSYTIEDASENQDTAGVAVTVQPPVVFAISGPSSVTEDSSDGDGNEAEYTISYSGEVALGETVSVDVAHTLNQTSSSDYSNSLTSAINAAISGMSGVAFDGTTLSFTNSGGSGSPSAYAGTASQSTGGDGSWTNISNATGSATGTYASVTLHDHDESSDLRLTNFGLNIPASATITGIAVALTTTAPNAPRGGHGVKLTKNGTTAVGTTTSSSGTWSGGSLSVGGSANLWNTTWTAAEVNASSFGLIIQIEGSDDDSEYRVDRAQVTVTYTGGGGVVTSVTFALGVEDDIATSESNEAYSIQISNPERTGVGSTTLGTSSVQTTIVNDSTLPNQAPSVGLTNTVAELLESVDTTSRIRVADITITDDGQGTNTLGLSGPDAALFEIDGGSLYLSAGAALDYETKPQFNVTVTVDDSTVGTSPDASVGFTLDIENANEAAPSLNLVAVSTAPISEDTSPIMRMKVASIFLTDDGAGTHTLSLSGADAALFEVDATGLYLKAGVDLNYDTNPVLDVVVNVDDPEIGTGIDDSAAFSIDVADVNKPPRVSFSNATLELPEDTDTTDAVPVADIVVSDDLDGSYTLALTGPQAALFEIVGTTLFLKAGTSLDHESLAELSVTVTADDPSLGTSVDGSADLLVQIVNLNDVAPVVSLENVYTSSIAENQLIPQRFKVADIIVGDDGLGTVNLALSGDDAALFEIYESALYLKAGTALDRESNPVLNVSVTADDPSLGTGIDSSAPFSLTVGNADEAPTISFANATTSLAEDVDLSEALVVAELVVMDDLLGSHTFQLSGPQAYLFEIVDDQLVLKAGTVLDHETLATLTVTVAVYDVHVGGSANSTATLVINVTNVNDVAPTVSLSNLSTTPLEEDVAFPVRVKVADIDVDDDGAGNVVLALTGDDAALFEIYQGGLYIAAGTVLDFETNPVLDVWVTVDDAALGAGIDGSAPFMLAVNDVNEAPAISLTNVAVTSLAESTDLDVALKVADIVIADDVLGENELSLTGADAALFEIIGSVLYLKAGTILDYETNAALDVSVNVDDPDLGTGSEHAASTSITVTNVTLAAVDDELEVENTSRDEAVDLDILANDFADVAGPLTIISVLGAAHGVVQVLPGTGGENDTLSYTADYGITGTETLTYVVEDANGNQSTGTVTLTVVEAEDANHAPAASTILLNTTVDVAHSFKLFDFVVDPDGDDVTLVSIGQPQNGTLTSATDSNGALVYTYTPDAGFAGTESVAYSVVDEFGYVSESTIVFSVGNSQPLAVADSYTVESGTTLNIDSLDPLSPRRSVLANDADADGQTLTATLVTTTSHGTLTFDSDGTFVYTPGASYVGTDSFTYKVNDGLADSESKTVTITVTAVTTGTGEDNGVVTYNPVAPLPQGSSADTGVTTRSGTPLGSFPVNPTQAFSPPASSGSFDDEDERVDDTTVEVNEDDVTLTTVVNSNDSVQTTRTVNPDGSWSYWESYTSWWTTDITGSDGSTVHVSGTYSYTLTAHGDPTYSAYTFTASTSIVANGSFSKSWGGAGQSGSMDYTWTQMSISTLDVSNFTNFETGLAFGTQSELAVNSLSYIGSGDYAYAITGGSVSGDLSAMGMQTETTSLASNYVSSPSGWIKTGNGSTFVMGVESSNYSGDGSYTITETSAGVSSTTNGAVSENGSEHSQNAIGAAYNLGTSGWYMAVGAGMITGAGNTSQSTVVTGTYGYGIPGGSVSGTFNGSSSDRTNYDTMISMTGLLDVWTSSGTGTQSGSGNSNQSSNGSGSYSTSTNNGAGSTSSLSGTISESSQDSANYSFGSTYSLLANNTWSLSNGSGSANGQGSNASTNNENGSYTRPIGDPTDPDGTAAGTMSSSRQQNGQYNHDVSSSVVSGSWVDTGAFQSSGDGASQSKFKGGGSYSRTTTFEDGTVANMSGRFDEEGKASEQYQFQTSGVLAAGGWVQTSGSGTSSGDGDESIKQGGTGTYVRIVTGGTVRGTAMEYEASTSDFDFSVTSTYQNGAWTNVGSRNDSSDFSGDFMYESDVQQSTSHQQTSNASGSTDITYKIEENANQHYVGDSSSVSVLDAESEWQLASGDSSTTTSGDNHLKSTGTGTYTEVIDGITIQGDIVKVESIRDSNYYFTIDSAVIGGAWHETSGNRYDGGDGSDMFDANGSAQFSSGSSGSTHSTSFSGTAHHSKYSESSFRGFSLSDWSTGDVWITTHGSGSSRGSGNSSFDTDGSGTYTRTVEGGSVTGTSTLDRGRSGNYTFNTRDKFTNGAWNTTGSHTEHADSHHNESYTGDGTYSRTVDDGNGNSYTETGTVHEETQDNWKLESDGTYSYVSGAPGGWVQQTGKNKEVFGGKSMLDYTTLLNGNFSIVIDGATLVGTLTRTTSIGVQSYTLTATTTFSNGAWSLPTGTGSRVELVKVTTTADVSGQKTMGIDAYSVTGTLTLKLSSGIGDTFTENFEFNALGQLVSTGIQEGAIETLNAKSGFVGQGAYSRSIENDTGTLNGTAKYETTSSFDASYNYTYGSGGAAVTGTAKASGESNDTLTFEGDGTYSRTIYANATLNGTAEEKGRKASKQSGSVDYALNAAEGVWEPTGGTNHTEGNGQYKYEAEGTGNYSQTVTSTVQVSELPYESIQLIGGGDWAVSPDLPGLHDQVTTSTISGKVYEKRSEDTKYRYHTDSDLIDGVWNTTGSANVSAKADSTNTTEKTTTHTTTLNFNYSSPTQGTFSGSFKQTNEKQTSDTTKVARTHEAAWEFDDGWRQTDDKSTYSADVTATYNKTVQIELKNTFDDPNFHHDHVWGTEHATLESGQYEDFTSYYKSNAQSTFVDGEIDQVTGTTDWGKKASGNNHAEIKIDTSYSEDSGWGTETFHYEGNSGGNSFYKADWTQPVGGVLSGGVLFDTGHYAWNYNSERVHNGSVTPASGSGSSTTSGTFDELEQVDGYDPEELISLSAAPFASFGGVWNPGPSGTEGTIPYSPPAGSEPEEPQEEEEESWGHLAAGFIPVYGSARDMYESYQKGEWGWMAFNGLMLAIDLTGVGALAKMGVKAGVRLAAAGIKSALKAGLKETIEEGVQKGVQAAAGMVDNVAKNAKELSELRSGVEFEAKQLAELGLSKNTTVWRPSIEQTQSAAFKVIVGKAKYTKGGLLKGTILDATKAGLLEIKGGSSILRSTYQLRLQTYRSLIEGLRYTIRTTRPINPLFHDWLQRWGVIVEVIK